MKGPLVGLGEALAWLRQRRGLRQQDVAEAVGLSVPSVSRYETGADVPKTDVLSQLLEAMEADTFSLAHALHVVNKTVPEQLQLPSSLSDRERSSLLLTLSSFQDFLEAAAWNQVTGSDSDHGREGFVLDALKQ